MIYINNRKKSYLTINAISGIQGLEPSLEIIKHTKNLAIDLGVDERKIVVINEVIVPGAYLKDPIPKQVTNK